MPAILSRFRIEGLHYRQTIDIPIVDNKLVLVGENGTGKSTVANLIYFSLTAQWKRMLAYRFKKIEFEFNHQTHVFSYDEIKLFQTKSTVLTKYHRLPRPIRYQLEQLRAEYSLEELLDFSNNKQIQLMSGFEIPERLIIQYFRDNDDLPLFRYNQGKIEEIIKENTKNNPRLYLPTYRRIEQGLESIFPELNEEIQRISWKRTRRQRQLFDREGFTELVEFGMEDVEKAIKDKMRQLEQTVRKDLRDLTGTYLKDVVQGVYREVNSAKFSELNEETVSNIFKRIPPEILSPQEQNKLKDMIATITQTGEIAHEEKVIAHFLIRLIQLYQKQQDDEKEIKKFIEICNEGYLVGKQFVYDDLNFEVSITQNDLIQRKPLPLQALSSGEKQIISLFSHLYLSGKKKFFVIIDEPELSLSVPWQRRFLTDMLAKCEGLVAVTHSPFIFDNELRDYTHSLEEFTEPYTKTDDDDEIAEMFDEIPF